MKYFILLLFSFYSFISCTSDKNDEFVHSASKKKIKELQKNSQTEGFQGKVKSVICTNYRWFIPHSEITNYETKIDYQFDERGNLTEEKHFNENLAVAYIYRYYFDKMGNDVAMIGFDENNKETFRSITTLNEAGLITKTYYKDAGRENDITYAYKVISDSLIEFTSHDKFNPSDPQKDIRKYKNGNLVYRSFSSKAVSFTLFNEYDSRNNIILGKHINSLDNIEIWKYQYDDHNRKVYQLIDDSFWKRRLEAKTQYDQYGNITEHIYLKNGEISQKRIL